jgi:hypothetical protein
MGVFFEGRPAGRLVIRTLADAWRKIDEHEQRLKALEERLSSFEHG